MTPIQKIRARLAETSLEQLKEIAKLAMRNHEEGAAVVFSETLDELERRLPEAEFVNFCDTIHQ